MEPRPERGLGYEARISQVGRWRWRAHYTWGIADVEVSDGAWSRAAIESKARRRIARWKRVDQRRVRTTFVLREGA